jgi:DNA repair exonuclease SbcCD ATPase subunit
VKIEFTSLEIYEFKAIKEVVLPLDTSGVTFVRGKNLDNTRLGPNGVAKSTLWDAWCWCLFGRTPLGLRNPDVVPWSGGHPIVVVLATIDGRKAAIERSTSPNRLLLDGKEVSQDRLESKLGFNFDLATNTILLAQDKDLFFDRPPREKMDLFSDTLQLDKWDTRSRAATDAADVAQAAVVEYQRQIDATQASINEIKTTLADVRKDAEAWATAARGRRRDRAKEREVKQSEFERKQKQLNAANLREDGAETELRSLNKAMPKLQAELATAKNDQRRLKAMMETKICPTCGQPLKKAHPDLGQGIKKIDANVISLTQRVSSSETYMASFQATADSANAEMARLMPEVARLQAQLNELREVEEVNPHTARIKSLTQRGMEFATEAIRLGAEKQLAEKLVERNKFWVKGFKDIKLQLISDVLDDLELVTNGLLEEVGLTNWEIRYDIERETKSGTVQRALSVQINSPQSKGWVKWESWSGGEKQRLKVVGSLALSDVLLAAAGVQTNLEILDEPAVYWSSEGVQELCGFLAERARDTHRNIFYIEHNAVESAHFSQVLTVCKGKDGAYLEESDGNDTRADQNSKRGAEERRVDVNTHSRQAEHSQDQEGPSRRARGSRL